MTHSCLADFLPDGLSPYSVDPNTGEITDFTLNHWRTYETAPKTMFEEDSVNDLRGNVFMIYAENYLGNLFNIDDRYHNRYFGTFTEMMFKIRAPMDINRLRWVMNNCDDFQEVYTWIPSKAVNIGHRICYAVINEKVPQCKITGVTADDGKIYKIMITIFSTQNRLRKDLNKELAYYFTRKGLYKVNYYLEIDGIEFPYKPSYRT